MLDGEEQQLREECKLTMNDSKTVLLRLLLCFGLIQENCFLDTNCRGLSVLRSSGVSAKVGLPLRSSLPMLQTACFGKEVKNVNIVIAGGKLKYDCF